MRRRSSCKASKSSRTPCKMPTLPTKPTYTRLRLAVAIHGAVQGVGFRPNVYRLARELSLNGWIRNNAQGVYIEAEAEHEVLETFLERLSSDAPPLARITSIEHRFLQPEGYDGFEIRSSQSGEQATALISPDVATCPDCLRELLDPKDRRYRYPFINCTNCGPRYSIVQAIPYDRANTTMRLFDLCPECEREYSNPGDRRFHAQPNACPACGPSVVFWCSGSDITSWGGEAIELAEEALRQGLIIALKGIGGYQLLADATNPAAVERLRQRKRRGPKPFAIMCPDLATIAQLCFLSTEEAQLVASHSAPIVLLQKREASLEHVAPGVRDYGVMLPYSPIHHLLAHDLRIPMVATSGNQAEEPICIDETEARERLGDIADAFLSHNRPIARAVDDSVARVLDGRVQVLRRARGYAPLPLELELPTCNCLAVGAQLKNAVAISNGGRIFPSQHIGDLESPESWRAFERTVRDLPALIDAEPESVVCDLHPDYASTRFARASGLPCRGVQHHLAHVYSCIADNQVPLPVLGFAWDGAGYGEDGTVWGGECFRVTETTADRVSSIKPFPLLGGDQAARDPRRVALALVDQAFPERQNELETLPPFSEYSPSEWTALMSVLHRHQNPMTTSIGRLFDAVACILGICSSNEFEGEAAMRLEEAASRVSSRADQLSLFVRRGANTISNIAELDWIPWIRKLMLSRVDQQSPETDAFRFHQGLADWIVEVARSQGIFDVVLSGGCFQNRLLCELAGRGLRFAGFRPWFHNMVPPNDGGIAVGQLFAAARHRKDGYQCA